MRLKKMRIENFRSFADETIVFDDYTCLVGANGAGKSAVLMALNIFFRNNASTVTDVISLNEEDFHHKNTAQPVKITFTFEELSKQAELDLGHYYRQGKLVIFAKAEWNDESRSATVKQYGSRLVMPQFKEYFEADENKAKVNTLREIYVHIRKKFPELPHELTKPAMKNALREYENTHLELCDMVDADTQFYGWSKGANRLAKYIQWIYVPAVKDAASEQDEGSKTALGDLLKRTIRTKIDFSDELHTLQAEVEVQYENIIRQQKNVLNQLGNSIEARLQQWTTQNTTMELNWTYDKNKSIQVKEPYARVFIGEDDFVGEVPRLGHGIQRAFILSVLQELATNQADAMPTLLLGFEEPELYQHPPQAQHIADLLVKLAESRQSNTQVIVTTHSPYFVSGKGFENVRVVRKTGKPKRSRVSWTRYSNISNVLAKALGEPARSQNSLMASVEQIMQPSQRELFFIPHPIFVEGLEDVAILSTHLQIIEKWAEFRTLGCYFVIAQGKTNLSRLIAIANELKIPSFVVFDADGAEVGDEKVIRNERDNSCILKLCGMKDFEALPKEILWHDNVAMWPNEILDSVIEDVGREKWDSAKEEARKEEDLLDGVKQKNSLLIAATLYKLNQESCRSAILDTLSDNILTFARRQQ